MSNLTLWMLMFFFTLITKCTECQNYKPEATRPISRGLNRSKKMKTAMKYSDFRFGWLVAIFHCHRLASWGKNPKPIIVPLPNLYLLYQAHHFQAQRWRPILKLIQNTKKKAKGQMVEGKWGKDVPRSSSAQIWKWPPHKQRQHIRM